MLHRAGGSEFTPQRNFQRTGVPLRGGGAQRVRGRAGGKVLKFQRDGAAGGIRTPDPNVRSVVLYPTELRPRTERIEPKTMRAIPGRNFGGRDLTTTILAHKKSATGRIRLEPPGEQHLAAADEAIGSKSA